MRPVHLFAAFVFAMPVAVSAQHAPATPSLFSAASVGGPVPPPWRHQTLPRVSAENRFALVEEGGRIVLRVESVQAASTKMHPLDVDLTRTPRLEWTWKVSNAIAASDFRHKQGDDYAARVYVLFDYPVERLPFGDRMRIALARGLHGSEMPTAAIAYVWGTAQPPGATGPNPYTDRVQMIVVDSGDDKAGRWQMVRRDVGLDFEAVFGEPAPRVIGIAVGADTDNNGETVTAWFGDIRFLD